MYTVSVQRADGEYLAITKHENLRDAITFLTMMHSQWPETYVVRDAHGNAVYFSPETELG